MYAIRAFRNPSRIEVTLSGVVDASEIVRCISQALALADAGATSRACVDLGGVEPGRIDQHLIVAALRSCNLLDIKLAVVASGLAARMSRHVLNRASLALDAASVFAVRADAEQWLGYGNRSGELAETDRRHIEHAATLLTGAKGESSTTARRTSVA